MVPSSHSSQADGHRPRYGELPEERASAELLRGAGTGCSSLGMHGPGDDRGSGAVAQISAKNHYCVSVTHRVENIETPQNMVSWSYRYVAPRVVQISLFSYDAAL